MTTTEIASSEIRIDRTARRVRADLGGHTIADSSDARLAYLSGRHPEYLFPVADVVWTALTVDETAPGADHFGSHHPVASADGACLGRRYVSGPAAGFVRFDFDAMDAWFEEDEQIWFHARDPYRRVDVIESSRHVEITVDGVVVASSDRPRLVTETGLPERWYVPRVDVDWSKLAPSETTSGCQYKGIAQWWHVHLDGADPLADVAWGYERPIAEASKLAGLVAFYAEHAVVETLMDGVAQPKPDFSPSWLNPSLGIVNTRAS